MMQKRKKGGLVSGLGSHSDGEGALPPLSESFSLSFSFALELELADFFFFISFLDADFFAITGGPPGSSGSHLIGLLGGGGLSQAQPSPVTSSHVSAVLSSQSRGWGKQPRWPLPSSKCGLQCHHG